MDQVTDAIANSLVGFGPFAIYVGLSLGMIAIFAAVYTLNTGHREWALIRANNGAAAIAFSGALVGYALPLGAASFNALDMVAFLVWALIAIVVQLVVYWFFRLLMMPDVTRRLEQGEVAAGLVLASASIAGGIVNAAAMAA